MPIDDDDKEEEGGPQGIQHPPGWVGPKEQSGQKGRPFPSRLCPPWSTVTIVAIWRGSLLGQLRPPGLPKQEAVRGLGFYPLGTNHVLVSP